MNRRSPYLCALVYLATTLVPAGVRAASDPDPTSIHSCSPSATPAIPQAPSSPYFSAQADTIHTLSLEFRDLATGALIPVRCAVFDVDAASIPPADPEAHLYHAVGGRSYFYCDGQMTIDVPEGFITIKAGKGFQYYNAIHVVNVTSDTTVVTFLERFADMEALGWYSGDTHVHVSHGPVVYDVQPGQVITMMSAEGLNFVNSMEEQPYFTGSLDPSSTVNRLLYFSKEQRNAWFGHLSIVGLKQWISNRGCAKWLVCGRTLNAEIYEEVHAQGDHVLVIGTHPFPTFDIQDVSPWPGGGVLRGLPMDLVAGTIDAYDLLSYSHALPPEGVTAYFDVLNAGGRVSSSAGSDAALATAQSYPAGGYRVYVSPASGTPPGTPDEAFEGWVDALAAGASFVTNYPLITSFEVEGVGPGGTVPDGGGKLRGSVSAVCIDPLTKVEIIGNGSVLLEILPVGGTDGRSVSGTFQVDRAALKWIVARVTGLASGWHVIPAAGLFAQTGPVYIEDRGPPLGGSDPDIVPLRDSVNRLIDLMEDVDYFFSRRGHFPDSSEAVYEAASTATLDSLARIYPDPPEPFELVSPLWVSLPHGMPRVDTDTPTFVWCGTFDPDPGDGVTYTFAIDTQPDMTSPTLTSGLLDTTYTIPAAHALQDGQVYYWQVRAIDQTGLVTVGTPEDAHFIVDMISVAVTAEPSPSRWALSAAWPNPFNPSLQISYAVPSGGGRFALDVYNARGKLVRSLFLGRRGAGAYVTTWDGRNDAGARVTSGVYFVRLRPADGAVVVRKVVLLK